MKLKVGKASKTRDIYRLYLPKDIGEGYDQGETEALADFYTITLIKPGATLEQTEHSLEIALDDIRLRLGRKKLREVLKES